MKYAQTEESCLYQSLHLNQLDHEQILIRKLCRVLPFFLLQWENLPSVGLQQTHWSWAKIKSVLACRWECCPLFNLNETANLSRKPSPGFICRVQKGLCPAVWDSIYSLGQSHPQQTQNLLPTNHLLIYNSFLFWVDFSKFIAPTSKSPVFIWLDARSDHVVLWSVVCIRLEVWFISN